MAEANRALAGRRLYGGYSSKDCVSQPALEAAGLTFSRLIGGTFCGNCDPENTIAARWP